MHFSSPEYTHAITLTYDEIAGPTGTRGGGSEWLSNWFAGLERQGYWCFLLTTRS